MYITDTCGLWKTSTNDITDCDWFTVLPLEDSSYPPGFHPRVDQQQDPEWKVWRGSRWRWFSSSTCRHWWGDWHTPANTKYQNHPPGEAVWPHLWSVVAVIEVTVVVSQELLYGFLLGLQELQIAVDLLIYPLVTRVFLPWLLLCLTPGREAQRGDQQS